ncbi:uncharacterized protein DFL_001267 [Arthrobotrys flagrans]|uniref:Uncharacterized protein n=1 Tax=Arthrobotrys flagrans TaxID=97331 RepID=A0A437AGM2_ARTFL|nr:hypothetical protein DFL_001267 [Arthrobotrys flagrans]
MPPTSSSSSTPLIPQTPTRELWTEPEKYDLLWSIILSTGLTATTIPWHKIALPRNHTQPSAQVVIQDIALGKHHITHPTFTPSNKAGVVMVASRDLQYANHSVNKRLESGVRGGSKKRKLDDDDGENKPNGNDEKEEEEGDTAIMTKHLEQIGALNSPPSSSLSPPNSSLSSPGSPTSNPDHHQPPTTTKTTKPKPTSRRHKSSSPPINLDLSNPRITSYLKSSGYMNEDGTPVKKRRGRPTKDPFGLSVTLKKQLMRMDPNAPPMKKRGRPRKRFLDLDGYNGGSRNGDGGGMGGREDGSISPGLRLAIEKIGEEMVEELLVQGRSMRDTEDDDEESEGYDGEVAEVWEGDETEDEEEGYVREKQAEEPAIENKPESMILDEKDEGLTTTVKAEERKEESVPTRQVEKMAVDNLVEKPKGDGV